MAPIPKGGGKGYKVKSGGGGGGGSAGGGCCGDLTPGETAALVLSCIFGPVILWILFCHCLLPMCGKMLDSREKRRQEKLQMEAALGASVPLVEQPPPLAAPAAYGDVLPSQTPAGVHYYTPTARILTPIPPAAQAHYPPPYESANSWNQPVK
ncbi:hypothetical protein BGX38DRAFT_1275414 [Terfezia claveryi]|nr:hypothetical protein BGX38DRAFT_658226 [Terfezia claveryi]KAF8434636.1 hypothetical protein BGX38DRAFT_1275414 [Terfezia claveryi]